MSIINQDFITLFKNFPFHSQDNMDDPVVVAKLFDIAGSATWYLVEYCDEEQIAFCYVTGLIEDEWGYAYIPELEALQWNGIPRIERDLYFIQKPISQYVPALIKGGVNG